MHQAPNDKTGTVRMGPEPAAVESGRLEGAVLPPFPVGIESPPERPWLKQPDHLKSLDDLGALFVSEPDLAAKLVSRCSGYLGYLQFHFQVFPVGGFPQRFPRDYPEFFQALTPKARSDEFAHPRCHSNVLIRALNEELLEYRRRAAEPATWTREMMPTLRDKIAFEALAQHRIFERREYARSSLARALEEWTLSRQDYLDYRYYTPDDFPAIVKRFGEVAILNSLPADDPVRKAIEDEIGVLGDILASYPPKLRLNPRAVAAHDKEVFAAARALFGRLSWAVEALAPVDIDSDAVRREAFRAYVTGGREAALGVLQEWRTPAPIRGRIIGEFARNWSSYCGSGSNITTSAFEREVLHAIQARGFFVRTQVPYRELCATDRRFVADIVMPVESAAPFVLESKEGNLLIIEVSSLGDDFVHGEEYRRRMEDKRKLAEGAGILFVELTELDSWRPFIDSLQGRRDVPDGAYRWLESPRAEPVTTGPHEPSEGGAGDPPKRYPFWESDPRFYHFVARRAS